MNQVSSRDPPLIASVKGFPRECGDVAVPTLAECGPLEFIDSDASWPFFGEHLCELPHLHALLRVGDAKDPVVITCELLGSLEKPRAERNFLGTRVFRSLCFRG